MENTPVFSHTQRPQTIEEAKQEIRLAGEDTAQYGLSLKLRHLVKEFGTYSHEEVFKNRC